MSENRPGVVRDVISTFASRWFVAWVGVYLLVWATLSAVVVLLSIDRPRVVALGIFAGWATDPVCEYLASQDGDTL